MYGQDLDPRPAEVLTEHDAEKEEREAKEAAEEKQEQFLVEQLKQSIISDLHALDGRIGREQCRAWLKANFIELPF